MRVRVRIRTSITCLSFELIKQLNGRASRKIIITSNRGALAMHIMMYNIKIDINYTARVIYTGRRDLQLLQTVLQPV